MGLFSGSKSSSSTSNFTETTNIGFSDVTGKAVHGSNNVIIDSDQGAISGGVKLGEKAIDANRNITNAFLLESTQQFNEASRRVGSVTDKAFSFGDKALNFGGQSLGAVERVSNNAVSKIDSSTRNSLSFAERTNFKALDTVASLVGKTTGVIERSADKFTSKLTDFAKAQSTNNDQRITDVTKWVVGGMVLLAGASLVASRK